jgi:hypothetical protein
MWLINDPLGISKDTILLSSVQTDPNFPLSISSSIPFFCRVQHFPSGNGHDLQES